MRSKSFIVVGAVLLVLAAVILGFSFVKPVAAQTQPVAPTPQPPGVPYLDSWEKGPHSVADAEAFTHWNDADPKEIPTTCAKCHSTTGFQDYIGADGSEAGKVDKAQPVGQVITCEACHNPTATALDTVTFPSGVVVTGLGGEARCMTCHQGNSSKVAVDARLELLKATDPDKVPAPVKDDKGNEQKLGFINVHYRAAAASQYGAEAMGGYQYEGKSYDVKARHVEMANTCVECHDPHTGELQLQTCAICHGEEGKPFTLENVEKIREEPASSKDYNGNGDATEPMKAEIEGLQAILLKAIQSYAKEVAGAEIKYNPDTYPYFLGTDDKAYPNWTPRLLKAAYNYQFTLKDPGIFAHNPKYAIELLYDSIEDLNAAPGLKTKTAELPKLVREDAGHFDGAALAFRDWDSEGEVPASCAKCHSDAGLPFIFENTGATVVVDKNNKSPASIKQVVANGFQCSTCHNEASWPDRYFVDKVTFPSGKVAWFADANANLCVMCHQGRQSKASIDTAIAAVGADKSVDKLSVDKDGKPNLRFSNPHYFAAGGTLFGTEVQGMYEYDAQVKAKQYNGRTQHPDPMNTCVACHDTHGLNLQLDKCKACHGEVKSEEDLKKIRKADDTTDYDGDGTVEGFGEELAGMQEVLLAEIQKYASTKLKTPIAYTPDANPYFFNDTNGNGVVDPEEAKSDNRAYFSARLLKAAYNYQWASKDPGTFAHNFYYVQQVLYDSIKDLNSGAVAKMKRAKVTPVGEPPAAPTPPPTPTP